MAENQYIYAVARIRSKELSLLDSKCMEQLLSCKEFEDCIRILSEKGWDCEGKAADEFLTAEREKTWTLLKELVKEPEAFDVFLYENDFHNLKAAIKQVCTQSEAAHIYKDNGTIPWIKIYEAVRTHDFSSLPEAMQSCGQEAYEVMIKGSDSQLCDVIVDKASLEHVYAAGRKQKSGLLKAYVELKTATADINIAIRSCKLKKSAEFLKKALVPCDTLNLRELSAAVLRGLDAVYEYLKSTQYADAVEAIQTSSSAFEKWRDDCMMELIIEPIAAYLLARENEIKCVRILLSGKANHLSEESIRERLREMYV